MLQLRISLQLQQCPTLQLLTYTCVNSLATFIILGAPTLKNKFIKFTLHRAPRTPTPSIIFTVSHRGKYYDNGTGLCMKEKRSDSSHFLGEKSIISNKIPIFCNIRFQINTLFKILILSMHLFCTGLYELNRNCCLSQKHYKQFGSIK